MSKVKEIKSALPPNPEILKAYFDKAVNYSRGDVQALLKAELDCAGPLLNVVLDGIDHFGALCYGFEQGSKSRFVRFLTEKMGIHEDLAKFLYGGVRCGVTHQGMPKLGITFFVFRPSGRHEHGKLFYLSHDNTDIWLNVIELAYTYIDAINDIESDWSAHIAHMPPFGMEDKELFDKAKLVVSANTETLLYKVGEAHRAEAIRAGRIDASSSSSVYTPENTFCTRNLS